MKQIAYKFMAFWLLAAIASPCVAAPRAAADGSMTKPERKYLLRELNSSEAAFLASLKGLTKEQWTFKPVPDVWSIQECAEHLVLAEDLIFGEAQKTLKTPPGARLPNATSEGDRLVVAQMEDRSKKVKTPKLLQPTSKFPTPESATKEFSIRREKTVAYVRTTQDPMRIHSGDGPSGSTADVYQFLLELAAHTARHTAQIREVQAAAGYPKS